MYEHRYVFNAKDTKVAQVEALNQVNFQFLLILRVLRVKNHFPILLLVILTVTALATPVQSESISLQEALRKARDSNPMIRAAQAEADTREAQISTSSALEDPMLSIEAMNYPASDFSRDRFEMTGNQLMFSQKIPFPGKRSRLEAQAAGIFKGAMARAKVAELEVFREVKLAFLDAYLSQAEGEILTERTTLISSLLTATRDRYSLGEISQSEILAFQSEKARLETEEVRIARERSVRLADIERLMGLGLHGTLSAVEAPSQHEDAQIPGSDAEFARLLEEHPMLQAMREEQRAALARVAYEKLNALPDFDLGVGYTQREAITGGAGDDFISARVSVSIPLWNSSKQAKAKDAAKYEARRATFLVTEEQNHLRHQIHIAREQYAKAKELLRILDESTVVLTQKAVEAAQTAYLSKEIGYPAALDAISKHFDARLERVKAFVQSKSEKANLDFLLATEEKI